MAGHSNSKRFQFHIPTLQDMEKEEGKLDAKHRKTCDPLEQHEQLGKVSSDKDGSLSSTESKKQIDSAVSSQVRVARDSTKISEKTFSSNSPGTTSEVTASTAQVESNEQVPTIPAPSTKSSSSLIVNPRQRGNPILKSVRNISWEYGNIIPDYVMGQANCAFFLSLRYHQLHPNYIHERLKNLGNSYDLRVMLVQVDVKEPQFLLKDIAKMCILADCTLILAFSPEEAGRYLETYKIFENKPPEALMEKTEEDFMSKFTDCVTKVKSVNKTDCSTLISHFSSLSNIIEASEEDLSLCPGFGPQKARRLHSLFHEPFRRQISKDAEGSGMKT